MTADDVDDKSPRLPHVLDYVNHRGERGTRSVQPRRAWFGGTEWHPEDQWLVECFDHDRGALRNYSIAGIQHWDQPAAELPTGVYRHFKDGLYLVVGTARDSETEQVVVRYRKLAGDFGEWVRPLAMFLESLEIDGVPRSRFEYLGNGNGGQLS